MTQETEPEASAMKDSEIEALLREAARREAEDRPELAAHLAPMPADRLETIVRAVAPKEAPRRLTRARIAGILSFAALVFALVAASTIHERSLPEYTLRIAGDHAAVRADGPHEAADVRLARGAPFELVLRPAVRAEGPVTTRFVVVHGGKAEPWAPPLEVDEGGSARVFGARESLFRDPRGTHTLYAVMCPGAEHPPLDPTAVAGGARPEGCRVVRGSVTFED